MAEVRFTDEQRRAIDAEGCDVLVSAAAGSGKTAVLIERVIRLVVERGVDIDRLLVVTFTEAAAAEMKRRAYKAVSEQLRVQTDKVRAAHLRRQQLLLSHANITTIHSFCLNLIRKYCHVLNLDPAFKVADVTEVELIKPEIMRETFEDWYAKNDGNFLKLVEIYGNAVTDDAFRDLTLKLYEFSRSCPHPKRRLAEWAALFCLEDEQFNETSWYKFLLDDSAQTLKGAAKSLSAALELSHNPNIHEKYALLLENEVACTAVCVKACEGGLNSLRAAVDFKFETLPGAKSKTQDGTMTDDEIKALKGKIQALRNGAKKVLSELKTELFFKEPHEQFNDIRSNAGLIDTLVRLINDFTENYDEAKREKNIVDFSDFEHFCVELLENEEIAAEVRGCFDEVMVDEYQDSNLVQELILRRVSNNNRFMVGDIKQSIYRFRMANPDLFREKYADYSKGKKGILVNLSQNFRSSEAILDAVNFLFKRLMTEDLGEVNYNEAHELKCGIAGANNIRPQFIVVDTDGDADNDESDVLEIGKIELEARIVAERISGLISGENAYKAGDIVILLRSPGVVSGVFANELNRVGIQAYDASAKGFFDSAEMLTMINLLKIIDNPRQDIPLIAALYSPVFMFTTDELVDIKKMGCAVFYDNLQAYLENNVITPLCEKIQYFFEFLDEWRERAVYMPVSELIWGICRKSGYYDYAAAMDGGVVRQANLNRLFEQAVKYEKTSYKGLFNFIKYIEKLQKEGVELGESRAAESENTVKIMSIHKSKGLEFPVVFVCGLGREFNLRDARAGFAVHRDLGFGAALVDLETRVKTPTLNHYAVKRKILRESLSEEMRVLYVALTRAKQLLIVTGCKNSKLCFANWVTAALESPNSNDFWEITVKTKVGVVAAQQKKAVQNAETLDLLLKVYYNIDNKISYNENSGTDLRREGRNDGLRNIPSKISVTEVKRLFYREFIKESEELSAERHFDITFNAPAFITGETEPAAARRGVVTHAVLERVDFDKHQSAAALSELVSELEKRRIIHPGEARFVNVRAIEAFMASPLAERIRRSGFVRKETRFVTAAEPSLLNPDWQGIKGRGVMLHGVIDLLFEEDGEIVIVDYKTDRVSKSGAAERAERYRLQMSLYTRAVERYFGKRVKETVLYFFEQNVDVML